MRGTPRVSEAWLSAPLPRERDLPTEAAGALRLWLPFQDPESSINTVLAQNILGVLWEFENSPLVTIYTRRAYSWPPLGG